MSVVQVQISDELRAALQAEAWDYSLDLHETVRRILVERYAQPCPEDCGCRLEEDPDRRDCACDGPCTMAMKWPEFAYTPDTPRG